MIMEQKNNNMQGQFDVVWLLKYLLDRRKFIVKFMLATTILSIMFFLCKPTVYTAKASILPVEEEQGLLSGISGGVGTLASMAGVNFGGKISSSTIITSDLYPKIAESIPFLNAMIEVKLPWEGVDTLMSYYEYECADTVLTIGKFVKKYTIGLPKTIIKAIKGEDDIIDENKKDVKYLCIKKKRMDVLKAMGKKIIVEADPIYGTIEISVFASTPEQASVLATEALTLIQNTATEHKTRRAKDILKFAEERYEEAMDDYESIYRSFSLYKDTHRNMVEERMGSEYQKLSDKYDLSRSILNTISSQVEQARLEVMQNTPVFTVIDPVVLPHEKYSPKLSLHIIGGLLLGFIGAVVLLLLQIAWKQVCRDMIR